MMDTASEAGTAYTTVASLQSIGNIVKNNLTKYRQYNDQLKKDKGPQDAT
jgi:hypothetical protein